MKKILFVFGTRPEAIKMAPTIKEFIKYPDKFSIKVCITSQHKEMLQQILDFFEIKPDYDLNVMKENQTLFDITINVLKGLEKVLKEEDFDYLFVQGDTTTAFAGALAGFYFKKKIVHIEAGLRSYNKYSPFPEEINRVLAGHIADIHFAPTKSACLNLKKEGITKNVFLVGNTVIDALFLTLDILKEKEVEIINYFSNKIKNFMEIIKPENGKRIILITGHRRENFGQPFENICKAILDIAEKFEDIHMIYPVHLNPNVKTYANKFLGGKDRIHLIEPLHYPYLVWLMSKSYLIMTDSGGIQEEAPSLGKPVVVLREVTERMEGVKANTAVLVGTDREKIVTTVSKLLVDDKFYKKMANSKNPYGNGDASIKIKEVMEGFNG